MESGKCSKWWQMRTNLEKTLFSLCLIFFVTTVIIILVGVVSRGGSSSSGDGNAANAVCVSKECVQTAGTIISMAEFSKDPCQDFYRFACGTYSVSHSGPSSVRDAAKDAVRLKVKDWLESTAGNNISMYDKAKTMYRTCMKSAASAPDDVRFVVEKAFAEEQFGSWPALNPHWSDYDINMERTLASLFLLGINVAFKLEIIEDSSTQGRHVLKISPSHQYLSPDVSDDIRDDPVLKTYIVSTLLQLGVPMHRATEAADDIISAEADFIQRKEYADSECGDPSQDDERRVLQDVRVDNVQQVGNLIPELNWSRLMTYLRNESKAFQNIPKNISVEVYCRKYVRDHVERLVLYSPKTVYNYLGWKLLVNIIQYLGQPFYRIYSNYRSLTSRNTGYSFQPNWKECLSLLEDHMLPVIATAYRENEVSDDALNEKVKIASSLRSSLTKIFSAAEWLDDYEKELLQQKVMESRFRLAMTEVTSRIDEVDDWFSDLTLEDDHAALNVLRIQKFEARKSLEKTVSPSNIHVQWRSASLTSGQLEHDNNIISVHFDKIMAPYLFLNQPSYLSFGAFGTNLAHDLLQYISNFNLMKEINGNKTVWDVMEVREKSKACRKEFKLNNRSISKDELMDTLTAAMNDLTSIRVSYWAYKSLEGESEHLPGVDYSNEQLFFLSFAQSLCEVRSDKSYAKWGSRRNVPSDQRVNTILRNFRGFSEAYGCATESEMTSPSQCGVLGL